MIDNGIIDLSSMQKEIEMKKREEIIKTHPYGIYQSNDGRWKTYIKDEKNKHGRRLIAKASKELLEDAIVCEYRKIEKLDEITFNSLFHEWIQSKNLHTNSSSYIRRIVTDWETYYLNDPIAKMDIGKFEYNYLDDWVHSKVKEYSMTKKNYYNMSIILRQGLIYAKEKGYIKENPFENVKVSSRMFRTTKKQEDGSQVFLENEQPEVERVAFESFERNPRFTSSLAVPLCFQLGTRAGELSAIKTSDIDGKYIHIQRMEVSTYKLDETSGEVIYTGKSVVEHTKSTAGDRWIYLTSEARTIIDKILETNKEFGFECEDYIFVCNNKRISATTLSDRLAEFCLDVGIPKKRMHKIRKTYISTLLENGMNVSKVREAVGHEKETTTLQSYCYNRKTKEQTEEQFEEALSGKKSGNQVIPFNNKRYA